VIGDFTPLLLSLAAKKKAAPQPVHTEIRFHPMV
jgi:hypothetical protein